MGYLEYSLTSPEVPGGGCRGLDHNDTDGHACAPLNFIGNRVSSEQLAEETIRGLTSEPISSLGVPMYTLIASAHSRKLTNTHKMERFYLAVWSTNGPTRNP